MYIATCIVTEVEDHGIFFIKILRHVNQKFFQFTSAHIFHTVISNAVLTFLIYSFLVIVYPFIIKVIAEGNLRMNFHIKILPIAAKTKFNFFVY